MPSTTQGPRSPSQGYSLSTSRCVDWLSRDPEKVAMRGSDSHDALPSSSGCLTGGRALEVLERTEHTATALWVAQEAATDVDKASETSAVDVNSSCIARNGNVAQSAGFDGSEMLLPRSFDCRADSGTATSNTP
ncbi:hypothetical protein PI124_g13924 [Phytophthora idaei]|nr:hypothetical protein PI124_g13924 [Phytophthora idaei]